MPGFLKKKQFWGSIVAFAILAYVIRDISLQDVTNLIDRVDYQFVALALASQFVVIMTKAFRWKTIVEKAKRLSYIRVVPLFSAGQVINILLPALTGQAGRILLFARKADLSKTFVLSTVVIEVLFDSISLLICIGLLSTATIVFPRQYEHISYILTAATLVLFMLLYLILIFDRKFEDFYRRRFRDKWPSIYVGIRRFHRSFTKGISLLKSSKYLVSTLGASLLSWLFHAAVIYFLFLSFGFKLPLISAVVIMVINTVALMVPITPGNAGTFELAVAAPLLAFNIGRTDAVMFALALHIVDFLPIMLMGSLFIHTERLSLKEIGQAGEEDRELLRSLETGEDETIPEEKKV